MPAVNRSTSAWSARLRGTANVVKVSQKAVTKIDDTLKAAKGIPSKSYDKLIRKPVIATGRGLSKAKEGVVRGADKSYQLAKKPIQATGEVLSKAKRATGELTSSVTKPVARAAKGMKESVKGAGIQIKQGLLKSLTSQSGKIELSSSVSGRIATGLGGVGIYGGVAAVSDRVDFTPEGAAKEERACMAEEEAQGPER